MLGFRYWDAQLVIAREHGHENWQALELVVRGVTAARDESSDGQEWVSLSIGDVREHTLKVGGTRC